MNSNTKRFLFPLGIIFLVVIFYFSFKSIIFYSATKTTPQNSVIVVGESNPGRIALYIQDGAGNFSKRTIDTGFRFVWTVKIGDVKGVGKNMIYAGVSDSFYNERANCEVVEFDPSQNYKKTIIDTVNDIRCKDLTIGDIHNDGKKELILGTHGIGYIASYAWNGGEWKKELIEENYVSSYDTEHNTSHKVSTDNLPFDAIVQTAVHIIRVGDADNDGKNEVLAAVSDPLEYPGKDHILLLRMYKFDNGTWQGNTIDTLTSDIPFKATIDVVKIGNEKTNSVLVGASPHDLISYRFKNGKWSKQVIDHEEKGQENVLKGVIVARSTDQSTANSIFAVSGMPQAAVYNYKVDGELVNKKQLVNLSELLEPYRVFKGISDTAFDIRLYNGLNMSGSFVVVGEQDSSFLADSMNVTKFGFEATSLGFTILLSPKGDGSYSSTILDLHSAVSLDIGKL